MTTTPQQPLNTRQLQELATLLALRTRRELLAGCGAIAHPLRQGAGTDGSELRDFRPDDDARLIRWASVAADAPITVREHHGKAQLVFPPIDPETVDSHWLYTIRLTK